MTERQKALDKFAASADLKPDEFLRETGELARKYRSVGEGRYALLARVLERCRAADETFRRSLKPAPEGEPAPEVTRAAS